MDSMEGGLTDGIKFGPAFVVVMEVEVGVGDLAAISAPDRVICGSRG